MSMRLSEHEHRKDRLKGKAVLDVWPLPAQAAVPEAEADEPLDRSVEGDDEPITEKVPATPPPREPGQR